MVVYLDLVVLLNFLVDGLLLLGTNRLTGHPPGWKRSMWAACAGGLYAGICMLPGCWFFGTLFVRMLVLGVMSLIAFGWSRSALQRGLVFVLLSMALGGIVEGLNGTDFGTLVLAAGAVALLCHFGLQKPIGAQRYQPVELTWEGKKLCLTALVDTGNTLRDPITGAAVLVAGADVAEKLGISHSLLDDPLAALATGSLPGARLIPYRAVGCTNGMLLGIQCERVKLNGQQISRVVAFAPNCVGKTGVYQVLSGGV